MEFPLNKGGQGVVKENFTILFSFSVMIKYKPLLFCIVVMHTYLISYNILKDFSRTLMIKNNKMKKIKKYFGNNRKSRIFEVP